MATPRTVNTWPLNGVNREFDITFDYLSRTFIVVSLVGGDFRKLVNGTDYVFVTSTKIRTTQAYGAPYTAIELRRVTSTSERLVEFQDASILHAQDLNIDSLQVMHVAEEARESATETIGVNGDGHLDARGRKIVNLAPATADNDALPFGQYKADTTGAFQSAARAEAAANVAQSERVGAEQARSAAVSASTNATNKAAEATQQAAYANDSAQAALRSADRAEGEVTKAAAQADRAKSEADRVSGQANAAAASASAASGSASAAAGSATTASQASTASATARDASQAARDAAVTAKNQSEAAQAGAQTARTGAETARTQAQTAASTATAKALEATQVTAIADDAALRALSSSRSSVAAISGAMDSAFEAQEAALRAQRFQLGAVVAAEQAANSLAPLAARVVAVEARQKAIGDGQNVTNNIALSPGTVYNNTTGRAIMFGVRGQVSGGVGNGIGAIAIDIDVGRCDEAAVSIGLANWQVNAWIIVPAGVSYRYRVIELASYSVWQVST